MYVETSVTPEILYSIHIERCFEFRRRRAKVYYLLKENRMVSNKLRQIYSPEWIYWAIYVRIPLKIHYLNRQLKEFMLFILRTTLNSNVFHTPDINKQTHIFYSLELTILCIF